MNETGQREEFESVFNSYRDCIGGRQVLSRFATNRCLAAIPPKAYSTVMSESEKLERDCARRVDLARKAFKEYFALCFWSSDPNREIHEEDIPFVIRGLRHYGGHRGYRIAAELCR